MRLPSRHAHWLPPQELSGQPWWAASGADTLQSFEQTGLASTAPGWARHETAMPSRLPVSSPTRAAHSSSAAAGVRGVVQGQVPAGRAPAQQHGPAARLSGQVPSRRAGGGAISPGLAGSAGVAPPRCLSPMRTTKVSPALAAQVTQAVRGRLNARSPGRAASLSPSLHPRPSPLPGVARTEMHHPGVASGWGSDRHASPGTLTLCRVTLLLCHQRPGGLRCPRHRQLIILCSQPLERHACTFVQAVLFLPWLEPKDLIPLACVCCRCSQAAAHKGQPTTYTHHPAAPVSRGLPPRAPCPHLLWASRPYLPWTSCPHLPWTSCPHLSWASCPHLLRIPQ